MTGADGKAAGPSFGEAVAAGTFGGWSLLLVGHPLDTIKVRMQTMPVPSPGQRPQFTGVWDCARQAIAKEGPLSLYKGLSSPFIGTGAIYAVVFGVKAACDTLLSTPEDVANGRPIWKTALAGGVAGAASFVITTPVELIKSRLQIQYNTPNSGTQYKGMIDCAADVVRKGGFRGLFRGSIPTIARDFPASMAWYSTYEMLNAEWKRHGNEVTPVVTLAAGGAAGVMNWLVMYPIDLVKTKVQTDTANKYRGMLHCFKLTYQEVGLPGMFRGLSPCLIRAVPANAACFWGYEFAMKNIDKLNGRSLSE